MLLLNFSHPFTEAQREQVRALLGESALFEILHIPTHFSAQQPYLPQVQTLLASLPIPAEALQTTPLLLNLPSFNVIAALLLAELHGRIGYFPPVLRLRPVEGSLPPRYEVAEILNLQAVRDTARAKR
ncbi:MAG TPA: CRISPR-associated protein Csx15 [Anaerolineales bacterium]|nr:CRISPR-associated protein Csx15 [Anaerolineales bacterium]